MENGEHKHKYKIGSDVDGVALGVCECGARKWHAAVLTREAINEAERRNREGIMDYPKKEEATPTPTPILTAPPDKRNIWSQHKYYEANKQDIIKRLYRYGRTAVMKKWKMKPQVLGRLEKRWRVDKSRVPVKRKGSGRFPKGRRTQPPLAVIEFTMDDIRLLMNMLELFEYPERMRELREKMAKALGKNIQIKGGVEKIEVEDHH